MTTDIIAKIRKTIGSYGLIKIVPPLDMGGNQIKDLADGTEAQDAVTLSQLQNGASAAGALMADGSVKATGDLDMDGQKILNSGDLDMGGNKIENIADGVEDDDPATVGQLGAVAALIGNSSIRKGRVTLDADGKARVTFGDDGPATLLSTQAGPYNLTGVGDGGTIIVNPDGDGAETVTINFAAGYHTGGTACATDMTAEPDKKFMIRANGDEEWHEVTCAWAGCNSGALIAAQIQTQVRAIVSDFGYDGIAVTFEGTDHLLFTSGRAGTDSTVEIDRADAMDCCDDLDIGPDNGTTTVGTGDVANAAEAAAAELVLVINTDLAAASIIATAESGKIRLTSKTNGAGSSLVMGDSTLKTVLGLANAATAYGSQGLGYKTNMADSDYVVNATVVGVAQGSLTGLILGITSMTVGGFVVECLDSSATNDVFVAIFGQAAAEA